MKTRLQACLTAFLMLLAISLLFPRVPQAMAQQVINGYRILVQIAAPSTPSSGTALYADSTSKRVCGKDDAGLVACMGAAGVNGQTGTTYTIATTDFGKMVTFTNASAVAVTLPQATTAGFTAPFCFDAVNLGVGTATITPTTSTINGAATLALTTGQGSHVCSNGTNYLANSGAGSGGGGSGSVMTFGTVMASGTLPSGAGYSWAPFQYAGTPCSGVNQASCGFVVAGSYTLKNLYLITSSAQPSGCNHVVTVYKNNSATSITLTVSAGAAAGTFSDTTHTAAVVGGDNISFSFTNGTCAGSANSAILTSVSVGQ